MVFTSCILFFGDSRKARMTSLLTPGPSPDQQAGIGNREKGSAVLPDPARSRRWVNSGDAYCSTIVWRQVGSQKNIYPPCFFHHGQGRTAVSLIGL